MQARWWKRHTPASDQRGSRRPVCGHCHQAWPCHSWACWDGQLGEAVASPGLGVESISEPAPTARAHLDARRQTPPQRSAA
ncbi:hypothetical protein [Glycomyces salinus]|uniref:hypothetical protein n=1 Tax=Glycomyces salinus TaxID=980294 RepID=UPI0018EE1FA6|nr:hypothetical protein [Glycomyces salinus]